MSQGHSKTDERKTEKEKSAKGENKEKQAIGRKEGEHEIRRRRRLQQLIHTGASSVGSLGGQHGAESGWPAQ